jgi:diguanylate cyclase (GGDEF)-like protein
MLPKNPSIGLLLILTTFCALVAGTTAVFANASQPPVPLRFEHLSVDDGLSNSEIMTILQDQDGLMWFGTQNGLNRYDGYSVTIYRQDDSDPYSISSSLVLCSAESPDGTLWFGTDSGGLNRYDKTTGRFTAFRANPDDPADPSALSSDSVWSLLVDRSGIVWAGTRAGLNRLDPATGQITVFHPNPGDERPLAQWVLRIYEDSRNQLWVGTRLGLNRLERQTGTFTTFLPNPEDPTSIRSEQAWAIYEDSRGDIWIGTRGGGLNRYDQETDTFTAYLNDPDNPLSLSHNNVWDIIEDPITGRLWVGTEQGGLNNFDPKTGTFTAYRHNPNDPYTLSHDDTFRLYFDRSGVLWTGSRVGGVNKLYPALQRFRHYRHLPEDPLSLSTNYASGLLVGADGTIWIGTRNGGLNKLDRSAGKTTIYANDPNDPDSLGSNFIQTLFEDDDGTLWIATSGGGLNRLNPSTGTFTVYKSDPNNPDGLTTNFITTITPAGDGKFWLGTLGFGLELFNPEDGSTVHYRSDPDDPSSLSEDTINAVIPDDSGGLWIGTFRGGLNHFDPTSGRFTQYRYNPIDPTSVSNNNVFSLALTSTGDLWVGTLNGLNHFDPTTETFRRYTTNEGLPDASIYCIKEDLNKKLWLSTARGLVRFDPQNGSIKNFTTADGVQSNQFYQYSCACSPSGELFFGGPNGVNSFTPGSIADNTYPPPVIFTGLRLFNQPIPIGSEIMPVSLHYNQRLVFDYRQDVITFEFAALNYQDSHQNLYRHRLEGFDKDWSPVSNRREATYTNLTPGRYTFLVQAANNDAVWNETPASLEIVITPPWWQTIWFQLSGGILLIGAIFGGVHLRIGAIRARNQELEQRVADRTHQLEHIAITDYLTGIFNRRHFFTLAEVAYQESLKNGTSIAVILLDADNFKGINDTHGHAAGDAALIYLATTLRKALPAGAILARFGGEEFIVLLTNTRLHAAARVASTLREAVAFAPIEVDGNSIQLTISLGVAARDPQDQECTLDQLIISADKGLYQAKHSGRNRVVAFAS